MGPRNRTQRWWVVDMGLGLESGGRARAASQRQNWGVGWATFPWVLEIISRYVSLHVCVCVCVWDWDVLLLRSMHRPCIWAHHFKLVMSRLKKKAKCSPVATLKREKILSDHHTSQEEGQLTQQTEQYAFYHITWSICSLIQMYTKLFAYICRSPPGQRLIKQGIRTNSIGNRHTPVCHPWASLLFHYMG